MLVALCVVFRADIFATCLLSVGSLLSCFLQGLKMGLSVCPCFCTIPHVNLSYCWMLLNLVISSCNLATCSKSLYAVYGRDTLQYKREAPREEELELFLKKKQNGAIKGLNVGIQVYLQKFLASAEKNNEVHSFLGMILKLNYPLHISCSEHYFMNYGKQKENNT